MIIKPRIKAFLPKFLWPIIARIESSPLGCRLAHGAFWSLLGALLSRSLILISSILVARILGKSGFGELGIIQSTVGMFGTFAGFCLGMTATKFIAEYRTTDPVKTGRIRGLMSAFAWITSGITALILFFMAQWLAAHTLAAPQLAGLLRIGSLLLFFSALNGAQIGTLSGFEAFKTVAKISLWCGVANFPFMVGGVYLAGTTGAVWGMVLATVLNWFLNHTAIRRECAKAGVPYTYEGCWMEKSVLWKFALPAVISSAFFAPTEWALNAMLVNQPGGYGQMGIFNAAKQWHVLILYIPMTISSMALPILSNLNGEGKLQQYNKMVILNLCIITGLALIAALPVSLFSVKIMSAYGSEFSDGNNVLLMVCAYTVLWAANVVIGQVLWTKGLARIAMVLAALRALILLLSYMFITPRTAYGLALSYFITYSLMTLYQGVFAIIALKKATKMQLSGI